MLIGAGIDLVSIPRFVEFWTRRQERGLRRLFTAGELDYCFGLARPAASLAARFAAKEAFFKALGTGYGRGGAWTEVEVRRVGAGRPVLELHGRAARLARDQGVRHVHLSLSHTAELATAQVLLEG
ncbi:MAG: holo-ACP synthase [Gemmatimonadetes bacterium]|nr:holo-ACP synthase [Gemmatimonadota bacterium]